jgi:hypothetical protein
MESQFMLVASLLLCGAMSFYLFLQYKLKQHRDGRGKSGAEMPPGLEIAASIQPSPGVKVHLLRWRCANEIQQGEFLLVTTGQAIQVTPCHALMPQQQHEIHSLSHCASHQ